MLYVLIATAALVFIVCGYEMMEVVIAFCVVGALIEWAIDRIVQASREKR
jgi:hypothetical protein